MVSLGFAVGDVRADGPEALPPEPEAIYALASDSASAPEPAPSSADRPSESPSPGAPAEQAPETPDPAPESGAPVTEESVAPVTAVKEAAGGASAAPSTALKADPSAKSEAPSTPKAARAPKNARGAAATSARKLAPRNAAVKPVAGPSRVFDEAVRARAELDRTDPVLRSVNAKVVRSFNKKAREEFAAATARQREAREALAENFYARAERLTLEARTLARETAVHLGPPQDDPDYVAMTLDRTDDALKRASEVLRDAGGARERRRLASLEGRQKESRRFLKDGKTRSAYASTREVRDGVLTLLRDCDDLPVSEATAQRAMKRASRSLDQAKGELGERLNAAAVRLSREARAQMAKAKAAFARKNYRDTLLHSKLVERNLELAVSAQRSAASHAVTNHSG